MAYELPATQWIEPISSAAGEKTGDLLVTTPVGKGQVIQLAVYCADPYLASDLCGQPDWQSVTGQFERIVILRFKHETDLLAGLERMVKQEKILNAAILAGTGSVRNYHFHVVSNRTFPSTNIFVRDTTAPADIVSMNGYVIDGRVHTHISMTDSNKAFGGHLERGTNVFTFAIVTMGVFKEGVDLSRIDDKTYR